MTPSFGFTYSQLESYLKCLRNLKPGDKVWFYISDDKSTYTNYRTDFVHEARVILTCKNNNSYYGLYKTDTRLIEEKPIIIGSDHESFHDVGSFCDPTYNLLTNFLATKNTYGYTRFLSLFHDILIARIEKQ